MPIKVSECLFFTVAVSAAPFCAHWVHLHAFDVVWRVGEDLLDLGNLHEWNG